MFYTKSYLEQDSRESMAGGAFQCGFARDFLKGTMGSAVVLCRQFLQKKVRGG